MRISTILGTMLTFGVVLGASASAEVVASQRVEKEVITFDANGREVRNRAVAEKVAPGEEVIYILDFENKSAEPASDLVLVMPVPREVFYVEGSVTGDNASVTFSVDGGDTYVARGRLTVREAGTDRPARTDDITHIRWILPQLGPEKSGAVSYRGILR